MTDSEYEKLQTRVRQAVNDPFYDGLSTRARNALAWNELDTKEKIIQALPRLHKIRNLGKLSIRQIHDWIGAADIRYCPHCKQRLRKAAE